MDGTKPSTLILDEMHEYPNEEIQSFLDDLLEIRKALNYVIQIVREAFAKALQIALEKAILLWDGLKDFIESSLPKHPEVIHPATKYKKAKQRFRFLVTSRKPMMIRARNCC